MLEIKLKTWVTYFIQFMVGLTDKHLILITILTLQIPAYNNTIV